MKAHTFSATASIYFERCAKKFPTPAPKSGQEEPTPSSTPRAAMRWYCLHPELPEKAVLRIRTAPNSSASVSGRVSKGKAVAALAPEFEIADESLSLARSAGGAPQRWLHVSFPDELSGAPTEGYVMASLPDGMRLLVPWEQAGTCKCGMIPRTC